MKALQLIILLVTLPILFLAPYFLFFGGHAANDSENNTSQSQPIITIQNKSRLAEKNLVISEHRFEKKNFLKKDKRTNIQHSIGYFLYSPPEPWPKDLKFPLIVHLSDHNNTAYSAEYITQPQMALAFPAFSIIPNTRGVYDKNFVSTIRQKGNQTLKYSTTKIKKPVGAINYKELRDQSKRILPSLKNLIEYIKTKYPIDNKRVYIVGCGFGGATIFSLIEKNPDSFASAVAISTAWETEYTDKFISTPLLIMTGKNNDVFTSFAAENFVKNINKRGGKIKYQAFESMPYTCSYKNFYSNKVWKWMFSKKLK